MKTPVFDYSECLSCGVCVQACPVSVLSMDKPGKQGKYKNIFPLIIAEGCIGCGSCARVCVMGCISLGDAAESR